MRMCWIFLALAALALPARARAGDPFADFRIPAHGWRAGVATLALSHSGSHSSISETDDRWGISSGRLGASFERGWDSDALRWSLSASADGAIDGGSDLTRQRFGDYRTDHSQRVQRAGELWSLNGVLRAYPWTIPMGLDFVAGLTGDYGQDWSRHDDHSETPLPHDQRIVERSHFGEHTFSLAGAIGMGRVRDATVVMDVHVLEQRLAETGALARPLSRAARERLAALESAAPTLGKVFDRPDRRVWRQIESILRDDGALSERGLDAYALTRAREPYRFATTRLSGWFVGPTVTLMHEGARFVDSTEISVMEPGDTSYVTDGIDDRFYVDSAWLGGKIEYHRALGWRWQVDGRGTLSGPVRPGDIGLRVESRSGVTWFVADRWQAVASLTQQRIYYSPRGGHGFPYIPAWRVEYGGSLGYFLEDHVVLSLSGSEVQSSDSPRGFSSRYERDHGISLGVTYRFLGRVEAPGLFDGAQPAR